MASIYPVWYATFIENSYKNQFWIEFFYRFVKNIAKEYIGIIESGDIIQ